MSARTVRFGVFGPGSTKGKAAGAFIACAVMLLAGCGGSGGSTSDAAEGAGSPVVRGDVLGADAVTGVEARLGSDVKSLIHVSWDEKQVNATKKVVGYRVQVASGIDGPWADAGSGCSYDSTKSATSNYCEMGNQLSGTYSFRVAAITKLIGASAVKSEGSWSAGSAAITVVGFPGTPTISQAAAGDGKATVTVSAAATGGAPTSLVVYTSDDVTKTCTITGAAGSCEVTGLTNSNAYTFTAIAKNETGNSGASLPSGTVIPGTLPRQPSIFSVSMGGVTTVTVTFDPVGNGGSPITAYTATSNPGGIVGTVSGADARQVAVVGLTPGTAYTFTVTSTNAVGTSLASKPSKSITTPYAIGSTGPGGGVVFYASKGFTSTGSACGTQCRNLEAAPVTKNKSSWCDFSRKRLYASGLDIGNGFDNTRIMAAGCTAGAGIDARATTTNVAGVVFKDWFLPSKAELAAYAQNVPGGVAGYYWSSSEGSDTTALWQIYPGNSGSDDKTIGKLVLPVRAF